MSSIITAGTLRTVRSGQAVRYTEGGDEAIGEVVQVLSDCLWIQIREMPHVSSDKRWAIGEIITARPGLHQVIELLDS